MNLCLFLFMYAAFVNSCLSENLPPPCDSEIYCYGRIIDSVMRNHIFNDSKNYVDLKLKNPPNETLELFDYFMTTVNDKPTQDQLQKWVEENFDPKGSELDNHSPVDHKQNLEVYNRISDDNFKKFTSDLNNIWIELSRKMKDFVEVSLRLRKKKGNDSKFPFAGKARTDFNYLREKSIYCRGREIFRILLLGLLLDCQRIVGL